MKSRFAVTLMWLLCLSFFSCLNKPVEKKEVTASEKRIEPKQKTQVPCVKIYGYGYLPIDNLEFLESELERYYPSVEVVRQHLKLPKEYYHRERNRYSGTGLLKDLKRLRKGCIVLGVTDEVIYKANELSPTYGIFGISPVGGHVAVISLTLPSGKRHTKDHLVKLMLHELGHAFGLNHCSDEQCLMVDAEHGNKFSHTPAFCHSCKSFLSAKGWK